MARLGVTGAIVGGQYIRGDVDILADRVASVGCIPQPGARGVAVPGMLDLQVNGFDGVDFLASDQTGWQVAAQSLARHGVTAHLAALISSDPTALSAALRVSARTRQTQTRTGSKLLGTHLEGPFLSPLRAGTHPQEHLLPPSIEAMSGWLDAGPVRLVTLAPELPGALDLIRWLVGRGVAVSLGHSTATGMESRAGFDAGACSVTHVFNAMTSPTAREAGLAGVALVREDVAVCLICDDVHVSPDVVRLVHAAARDRIVLVSDAIEAGGRGDGLYRLGDVEVEVAGGAVRRQDGTLAGSALPLSEAFRKYVTLGATLEQAVAAVTSRPASLIGIDIPQLRPGDRADVVVLEEDLTHRLVLVEGNNVS